MVNKSYFLGLFFLMIFLFGVSGWPKSLRAADYYVDNTCGYNGNGTSQTCAAGPGQPGPFNSLANAQSGLTGSQAGNRLLFKAGETFTGQYTVRAYGTSGHPFTISSYGTGAKPIINGNGTSPYGVISITNLNYITINGLALTNGSMGVWIYCTSSTTSTSSINISNCYIYGCPGTGICQSNDSGSRADMSGSTWSNNEITGSCAAIYIHRTNGITMSYNKIHDNGTTQYEPYGIAVEAGSNLIIHDNLIVNQLAAGIGIYGDTGSDGPSNDNQVYRNIIYGTYKGSTGWSRDITWQGTWGGTGNIVWGNILISTDSSIAHMEDDNSSGSGNLFYNNVCANGPMGMQLSGSSWFVNNNIFYNVSTPISGRSVSGSKNISYPNAGTVPGASTSNPLFTNPAVGWTGYTLQAGSPAIGAGANLGSPYNLILDPTNLTWPPATADENTYGWTIGAFVYRTGGAPAPPTNLRIVN